MSHTSQRRGLEKYRGGREMIVLAMVPSKYEDRPGIDAAMGELAVKMLEHGPVNWLSRNFTDIAVPEIGIARYPLERLAAWFPEAVRKLLMRVVGERSSVITAVYDDTAKVAGLLRDIRGEWLARNRERGYPISIVLSGLERDVHACCAKTGLTEHTYLHGLGFFGGVRNMPDEDELELMTMCGHGLIAARLVRRLAAEIRRGEATPEQAALELAKPCVCGIVNMDRAREILIRLARR